MAKHSRTKLVLPKTKPYDAVLETLEEPSRNEQQQESVSSELDNEIECPRCHEIMELYSKFDELLYSCQSCSFLLKCV
jgi:phage FluMu protein Com